MVYLKSLYSRLDRIAKRQGRRFPTEARSVLVNYKVRKCQITVFQNIENGKYLPDLMKRHPCEP